MSSKISALSLQYAHEDVIKQAVASLPICSLQTYGLFLDDAAKISCGTDYVRSVMYRRCNDNTSSITVLSNLRQLQVHCSADSIPRQQRQLHGFPCLDTLILKTICFDHQLLHLDKLPLLRSLTLEGIKVELDCTSRAVTTLLACRSLRRLSLVFEYEFRRKMNSW
jgi:hypothetical protein